MLSENKTLSAKNSAFYLIQTPFSENSVCDASLRLQTETRSIWFHHERWAALIFVQFDLFETTFVQYLPSNWKRTKKQSFELISYVAQSAGAVEIRRLHLCGGVRLSQRVSRIWHKTIWRRNSSNAGALGNVEYPFITVSQVHSDLEW